MEEKHRRTQLRMFIVRLWRTTFWGRDGPYLVNTQYPDILRRISAV